MSNVYIRLTPQDGCIIQKNGVEACYPSLSAARQGSDDAEVALALLCKGGNLFKEGSLEWGEWRRITQTRMAASTTFEQRGCRYSLTVFVDHPVDHGMRIAAVQICPTDSVTTYLDFYNSHPDSLQTAGFTTSSRLFLQT